MNVIEYVNKKPRNVNKKPKNVTRITIKKWMNTMNVLDF